MRFSCTQENFSQGLAAVSHVASKNVNLPILNNILIKVEEGVIRLSTTNLEIGVSCTVRGKVEEEGTFTVPARVLADYVSLLPSEKVDVVLKDDQLDIQCNNYQTKIKGEAASEFPLIPQVNKQKPLVVEAGDFLKGLQQVVFATAMSETRPEISGVLLNFRASEKKLILAATDSYRLAEKRINLKQSGGNDRRIIVPTSALQELQRILSNLSRAKDLTNEVEDNNLEIHLNDNQILFVYNNVELISRLVEGQYPDYTSIIPGNFHTQVIIAVSDLVKAVKSSSLFVKAGINDISLEFKPESEIIVSSLNAQVGENVSHLEANITGDDNSVVLNYRYFLDGLQALDSSEVVMDIIDNNTPVVLKPVLPAAAEGIDRDYLYLIMPIKQ
jgi:DNA polymerase-3 subunit beta